MPLFLEYLYTFYTQFHFHFFFHQSTFTSWDSNADLLRTFFFLKMFIEHSCEMTLSDDTWQKKCVLFRSKMHGSGCSRFWADFIPMQRLHSRSLNCHCFRRGFYSPLDLILLFEGLFKRLVEAPWPHFCVGVLIDGCISLKNVTTVLDLQQQSL